MLFGIDFGEWFGAAAEVMLQVGVGLFVGGLVLALLSVVL